MSARSCSILFLTFLLTIPAVAKDKKKKNILPEYILQASTAAVVIDPDAGEPVAQPNANATARENVEKALVEWGRFDLILPEQNPDLIFVVRAGTGKTMSPTVRGGPIDQRPIYGETTDGTVRVGAQQGHEPPLNDPSLSPPNTGPHMTNEVGPAEDMLAVYRGAPMDEYPLDSTPIWRFIAKDCLQSPNVTGVQKLRKEMADAEKPQTQTKKP
jgi:hypothetical protein